MSDMDAILARMAELTEAIKEKGPAAKTDLQWDDISDQFEKEIGALVSAQVAEKMARQPVRPGVAGDVVMALGSPELKGNRYAPMLREFANGQTYSNGGMPMKAIDLLLAEKMMDVQVRNYSPAIGGRVVPASDDLKAAVKALTSTGVGTGDEYVPTGMAAELWEDFFLASRVVANMQRIPQPTNPFDIPLGLGSMTWRKASEATAVPVTDPATAKVTLTATELAAQVDWSYTLEEDAIIAMMPAIRSRLVQSGGEIIDDFALNADATDADTGNINLVDANPDGDAYYLSEGQDGIRHQWLVDNTAMTTAAGGDALAEGDLTAALADMQKYAVDPGRLLFITDTQTYLNGFLALTNVATVDKFGPSAVVLTGQLAAYRGIPIIVSASHRLGDTAGKVPAAGGTLGSITIVNRDMWYVGFRRDLVIEADRDIQKRKYIMVASLREAIAAHGTRSSNTHTSGIANILV